jgi:hypothetical protein
MVGPLETAAPDGVLMRTVVLLRESAIVLFLDKLEGMPGASAVSDRVRREVKGGVGRESGFILSTGAFVVLERSRLAWSMGSMGSIP